MQDKKFKKAVKCPFCNKRYLTRKSLYDHMENEHRDELGGLSPAHYLFNFRYHKDHGECIICHKRTPWNEELERYERLDSEECKKKYREIFRKRMLKKYGKDTLLNDPDQQKKMLAQRKIGGDYTFEDGSKVHYIGTYEKDFLEYLDTIVEMPGKEVVSPAPQIFEYKDRGKDRFYIPDVYLTALNLIVEIKDGGDNPNTRPKRIEEDGRKEKIKDQIMRNQSVYNFIKIVNKQYGHFSDLIKAIKDEQLLANTENRQPEVFKVYD